MELTVSLHSMVVRDYGKFMERITMLYAHSLSDQPSEKWQPLDAHLLEVAELAASFAAVFNASALAFIIGYLHDLGKTSDPRPETHSRNWS